ncbi:MAG TPA: PAS domain S-box protein [Prolixibacteraceae bacterium]|nr:PAS domain S-box protein [Prolixibacteraceae bacterium]
MNPTFEMKMGLTKDEIINKKLSSQTDLFQQFEPLFNLSVIAGQPQQDRIFVQSLDSFYDVLIYSPSENHLATIWRDVTLMVEAESSLRESEEKYRQIFAIGSDALFMIDYNSGRILDVNPVGCRMFGYSKDALLKMLFKQLSASPEKLEMQVLESNSILLDETTIKSDGSTFPTEISLSKFNWSGRKALVASIRDISERVNAQKTLIRNEQKFRQLFDYSTDAILIIKNYRIIDYSQKALSLFQLKPEQLINMTPWNLSPNRQSDEEDSRNKAVEYLQSAILGNQPHFEWVFKRNNQSVFDADVRLTAINFGDEKVIQAVIRDITTQKETQQSLKNKEEWWKTALQINSVGAWDWNIITNEIEFSPAWKNLLGYEIAEIKNEFGEFEKRIHPDDYPNFYDQLTNFSSAKTDRFSVDIRMRCKNGIYKWFHSTGKIISYHNDGTPFHLWGTHSDITKQKINEEALTSEIKKLTDSSKLSELGYWDLDLRTMILAGSKGTLSIFGYHKQDQLSIRQIEHLIHPDDRKNFMAQFISPNEKSILENIFRIIVNEKIRYIISRSIPVRNSSNVLTGYFGTFQDITPIKSEDARTKEEKNFFLHLAETTPLCLCIVQDNKVTYANEKAIEITGFSSNEIVDSNITPFSLAVPDDRAILKKTADQVASNPSGSEKIEIRIESKNKRLKWIELSLSAFTFNEKPALLFGMNDISSHKKMESELSLSEKKYQTIASGAVSGIALVDQNGQFIYMNHSFQTITGLEPNEIRKKKYDSLFKEDDAAKIAKGIEAINLSITTLFSRELRLAGENQSWIKLTIKPGYVSKNEIETFIFYIDFIDSFKSQIIKLIGENQLGKSILENSSCGIAVFSHSHELIFNNPKFIDDLQIHLNEKDKTTLSEIEVFSNRQIETLKKAIREKTKLGFAVETHQNKQISIEVIPVEINEKTNLIVYTIDFTETKNQIDTLSLSIERFQGIFDHAPVGIALVDKNRSLILSNQAFSELTHFDSNELMFMKLDKLAETQYLPAIISNFSQLFTGISASFDMTFEMSAKNGEIRWINSTASPLKDNYGDTNFAIYIIEDISQAKKKEYALLANERLKTLNSIANSFAHEFNNLLMGLYGNSYLLRNHLKDDQLINYANKLLSSINQATELTHKLLTFSGKNHNMNILFDVSTLIEETLKTFNFQPDITTHIRINNESEKIVADLSQLKRTLQIIIQNSLDSMPEGGELTIETNTVYFESNAPYKISSINKGKYLRIVVTDTGIGIHPNDLPKIFDPFFSTKPFELNAGLGLSIAQKIVNQNEGVINVTSSVGTGSSFNIYIPIRDIDLQKESNQPTEKQLMKGNANILLIDDEEVVRMITSELLNELGYDVYSFSGGKKAIQFYKENSQTVDLVMLDKHMPEMDGFEVYKRLKEINPLVKIIILTGYNIDKEMEEQIGKGTGCIIQKPVSVEKLSQTILNILYR